MSRTFFVGVGFFLVFFTYFCFTAYFLPETAGPDFRFSRAAADFYHDENRMAVVPDDVDKMVFSSYGSSRLLRPPLGFFLPGQMAKLPILNELDRWYSYRVTVAMLAALTIVFIFLALKTYFNSFRYAAFGALSIALLPQFSFYASYFSDDMIAFASISLLAYIMVLIFRRGVTLWRQILFAFAAGLSIVSKPTAWIFLAPAIVFYLFYMLEYSKDYFKSKDFYLPLGLMVIAFIVGGGWWLIFNMYHYGLSEVILSKTVTELGSRYTELDLNALGFGAQGVGIRHLVFLNYRQFWDATYIAFVGNLDWLKIKVGALQYGFYLWLVIGMMLNALVLAYQTVEYCWKRFNGIHYEDYPRGFVFELLLYAAIALQVYIYTWHNVVSDIQVQGKYLMTMFVPILILSLSFFNKAFVYLRERFEFIETPTTVMPVATTLLFAIPIVVHLDALLYYVIPFYWPEIQIPTLFGNAVK